MRDYEDRFQPTEVETAAGVVVTLLPRMPQERGLFEPSGSWYVRALLLALVSRLAGEERERAVERLVRRASSLTLQYRILNWFGSFRDREDRRSEWELLGEEATRRLAHELVRAVVDADAGVLADEPSLAPLLSLSLDLEPDSARAALASKQRDDDFFLRLLEGCVISGRSDAGGQVHRIVRFDWEALVKLVGEADARERLGAVEEGLSERDLNDEQTEAIRLARLYADGHGPEGDDFLRAGDLTVAE